MNRYDVEINGFQTTQQLSDADAKALGLLPVTVKAETGVVNKAKSPTNKARKPATKADSSAESSVGEE